MWPFKKNEYLVFNNIARKHVNAITIAKTNTKIRVRYGSGRCDQFFTVGSSKIKIRTSSWHKARSGFLYNGVRN